MKIKKEHLNRFCIVKWKDAVGKQRVELSEFIKEDFPIIETYGKIMHYDKKRDMFIMVTENAGDGVYDCVKIWLDKVTDIKFLESAPPPVVIDK